MKKTLITVLTLIMIFTSALGSLDAADAYAATEAPDIIAEAGILIDGTTGEILYTKNEHAQLEPASTTKMITCLLGLENLDLDETMVIDAETPYTEGSRVYLLEGEEIKTEDVFYALMLESANDAAVAIGNAVAGDKESFAAMMNEKAKELGCLNTNFVNQNGLHEEGHVSTAYDLAMIAKACMQNETFRTLVSTYKHDVPATNLQEERHFYNTNRLLYDTKTKVPVGDEMVAAKYDGCIGIKTGYTSHAGGCLVAGAVRDDTFLIAVVLKSTDEGRFGDCISLLDYGFANYHTVYPSGVEAGMDLGTAKVKHGAVRKVGVTTNGTVGVTLPIEASNDLLSTKLVLDKGIKAPLEKGQEIGTLEVYEGDNVVATLAAITTDSVGKGTILSYIGIPNSIAYVIFAVVGIIILAFAALIIYVKVHNAKVRKIKKQRREERLMEMARAQHEEKMDKTRRDWKF